MTTIRIRHQGATDQGFTTVVSFDGEEYPPVTVCDPFVPKEEERLAWYFEDHLAFPFTDQVKAQEAAASIDDYGHRLFAQLFADPETYARYKQALQAGVHALTLEVAGPPPFHALHWEALKDPKLPRALPLDATMIRRNLTPAAVRARVQESPTVNVLVVTARPTGARDVGYRTISRPLVDTLRLAGVPVRLDFVRPGTYRALHDHLESTTASHGPGFYHVIHFDVHGSLLTFDQFEDVEKKRHTGHLTYPAAFQAPRYGRDLLAEYPGLKAFLFLESDTPDVPDPVEARELADLLVNHQVPIAILNACQSGKQVGASETSLGAQLMQAGVQLVLAMGYSVTVSAAELLMQELYKQLFAGSDLATAIRRGRQELHNDKRRRAYFNQTILLEDWLLPVVYQNQPVTLKTRKLEDGEAAAYHGRAAARHKPEAEPTYGFVGRDLDVLEVERRLLKHNLLLLHGMGGAGKTTLLHHLAAWWQTTGFVDQVFYFGYDEKAHTRQQILRAIAERLLPPGEFHGVFQPIPEAAQQQFLAQRLRSARHLLLLDNLESITGSHLAIRNLLSQPERDALRAFLAELAGGRTLVLLGSRSPETWLAPGTFAANAYELPGLDPEAASTLADRILERHNATKHRTDPAFRQLLKLLDGYPLPLEVVLPNLASQPPQAVLDALQQGLESIDAPSPLRSTPEGSPEPGRSEGGDTEGGQSGSGDRAAPDLATLKTRSLLACIDYSYGNLSPEAQGLLLCLAPFTGVLFTELLDGYSDLLRQQPATAGLPFERWQQVLQEAANWGLVAQHEVPGFIRLQPILPFFLRSRLHSPSPLARDGQGAGGKGEGAFRPAVDAAFRQLYDQFGGAIGQLLDSRQAPEKQTGQALAQLEYENLHNAVHLTVAAQVSFSKPYFALSRYLKAAQDYKRHLALSQDIYTYRSRYFPDALAGQLGLDFARILNDIATCHLVLQDLAAAEQAYHQELADLDTITHLDWLSTAQKWKAAIYHQLGIIAQEQRQWPQAEAYYLKATQIDVEFDDHYSQAGTYHNLGTVVQAQHQWPQAEAYYLKALQIYVEFDDRCSQANTYHQLGRMAEEQLQWQRAEAYYHKALQIYVEFDDRYSRAKTYHHLGIVAQAQRQWPQAEANLQQALQIKVEFGDHCSQANTYHQLGMVAEEQRQWQQAEAYYQKALQICVEFDDRYSQGKTYHNLGSVAQEQRQWQRAEAYYQQALQIFADFDDCYEQAGTYHQLGRVTREQRQWPQTREYFLKALSTYVDYKDDHNRNIVLRSLAHLWSATSDPTLPAAIAPILAITPVEAQALLNEPPSD